MNDDYGTAIPTHVHRKVGNMIIKEPICRCATAEPNTAGTIYCPAHGEMWKLNGMLQPVDRDCRINKIPNIKQVRESSPLQG